MFPDSFRPVTLHHEAMTQTRNIVCLAAYLIALLLSAGLAQRALAQASGPPAAAPALKGSDLNIDQIDDAIDKAITALYKLEPTYTFPPEYAFTRYYDQETRNMMGNHALACWAMLAAGESYQNPPLYRRINWVLSSDAPYVYDRGMRATMLNELPHQRWGPWINRDGLWLQSALTDEGNFSDEYTGDPVKGAGDNANGQYGVFGLLNYTRSSRKGISTEKWKKIDQYWRDAQQKTEKDLAAGWGVYSFAKDLSGKDRFNSRVSGPMTAGAVASLSITERFLYGPTMTDPKRDNVSTHLRKGLRWLDENFSLDDKDEAADWYYYMWTIQRVGGATGYRTFNGIDWFRDVTARILSQQQSDGTFRGDKGIMLSTGFALLYLSKANDPLAIAKVRFKTIGSEGKPIDGAWNNRPHDIWNFVDYASDQYEVSTAWQIAELTQPVYELMESPILYLATDQKFTLSDKEVDTLRDYINAGGFLILNAEGKQPNEAVKSFRDLGTKLFPKLEFKKPPKDHPFYNLHQGVSLGLAMEVVDNGMRPLIAMFPGDLSQYLQTNDVAGRNDAFPVMSNMYLYVTGMNPRRTRLNNNYIVENSTRPAGTILAARIKTGGNYDPEPASLQQLKALLHNKFNTDLQYTSVTPDQLTNQKIAFLTTTGDPESALTDSDAAAIRTWIERGGTLWLDPASGREAASKASLSMLAKILPSGRSVPMAPDNPILTGKGLPGGFDNTRVRYRFFAMSRMGPEHKPRLQSVELGNRVAIVYSAEDLTCGLAGLDHWSIYGYTPEFARRLVVNGVLQAMKNPEPGAAAAATPEAAPSTPTTAPGTPSATPANQPAGSFIPAAPK